jgi:hypothetical protein
MNVLSRRFRITAVLVVVVISALAAACRDRSSPAAERKAALTPSGSARVTPSVNPAPQLPAAPVAASRGIAVEVDGVAKGSFDEAGLADRPATLQAGDRKAWRLSELLHNTHIHSKSVIHALTNDGGDYILNEDGRSAGDAIVVRRTTGEIYIGWLDGDPGKRQLADVERPAERIENVARISITSPEIPKDLPPSRLAIIIDGKPRQTVTAQTFPALARLQVTGQREGNASAIDVAHAFGGTMQVVGLTASGAHVTVKRPGPDARPVIYMTRRLQFKFAWVDRSGEPIRDTKQRDVTELVLRTGAPVASKVQ